MKRFLWPAVGCFGAALIAAPAAQAQTVAPNPPFVNPYAPVAPTTPRIEPSDRIVLRRGVPIVPDIDPTFRMAPMPGAAPIPNLAPGIGERYSQRMAPMPGANPETLPRRAVPLPERLFGYSVPGTVRNYAVPNPAAPSSAPRPDAMLIDGDFLYILRGDTLVKVDKKTLKVVESTTLPALISPGLPNTLVIPQRSQKWPDSIGNHFGVGPQF